MDGIPYVSKMVSTAGAGNRDTHSEESKLQRLSVDERKLELCKHYMNLLCLLIRHATQIPFQRCILSLKRFDTLEPEKSLYNDINHQ